ncbi:hypothetical protein IGI04_042283 [Brassica rapa subsp. trilocularis]|uniref:Uncharacterized protein n=1 Tax=Brassica rapa subsp. trilocularis TaxID=1813537 RepID=A0ABQ7KMQ2_BRACM|nr:hypothetical protein IGI04_042283 [Brassica rapa subsp. trilocularis]
MENISRSFGFIEDLHNTEIRSIDQQSNKNMIGQPMIPHSFNIHHPSQAIPQTHTGQRQAYTNKIHTKPNPVPKPDLDLMSEPASKSINHKHNHNNKTMRFHNPLRYTTHKHSNLGPGDFIVQPPAEKLSLKITGTCTQQYQHAIIENMMHPSPSPSQRDHSNLYADSIYPKFQMEFKQTNSQQNQLTVGLGQNPRDALNGLDWTDLDLNMSRVDRLTWAELPHNNCRNSLIGQNFASWCAGWFEMSWGRGVYIGCSNQSETSRVAARVSLRMAPDACIAAPRAPHV